MAVTEKRTTFYVHCPDVDFIIQATLQTSRDNNINAFGAFTENVPTTAIFLLQYAEHSNVSVYSFIASQEVIIVFNTVVF